MDIKKIYLNKHVKLKINKQKIHQEIKSIENIYQLEYASKKNLNDLYKLNEIRYKLENIDYEYFYRAMCEFSIGLNKMDVLKISEDKQTEFNSSFENIHNEFKELENINMMRSYNMD